MLGSLGSWLAVLSSPAAIIQSVICLYGGASAGVIAPVQAVRLGQTVALRELGNHVGGLAAGGPGWTDLGNKAGFPPMASG